MSVEPLKYLIYGRSTKLDLPFGRKNRGKNRKALYRLFSPLQSGRAIA